MPDMITKPSAVIRFSTSSDDYKAIVRGKGVNATIRGGEFVPTTEVGFYTVSAFDKQLRSIAVTLADESLPPGSVPPTARVDGDEMVTIAYQVK